jgi:methionyl-tRNA formyltransferase
VRVLFLGPLTSPVAERLRQLGEEVVARADRLDAGVLAALDPAVLVSFGYRFVLPQDLLARFLDRAVNLHISYLPWNRGAHPNAWSAYEGTPAGVTIHHLDAGIDTGDVIAQKRVAFPPGATLRTSHDRLLREIEELFFTVWPAIRTGSAPRTPQRGAGSFHRAADLARLEPILHAGWDTPLADLAAAGARAGARDATHPQLSEP